MDLERIRLEMLDKETDERSYRFILEVFLNKFKKPFNGLPPSAIEAFLDAVDTVALRNPGDAVTMLIWFDKWVCINGNMNLRFVAAPDFQQKLDSKEPAPFLEEIGKL